MDNSISQEAPRQFQGFPWPQDGGFTRLPHDWLIELAQIDNLAELKVILYLMRHTWGFQEYDEWKHFTIEEFMEGRYSLDNGTGLSEMSVRHGLERAIAHGYILRHVDAHDKARKRLYYKLRMGIQKPDPNL